MTRSRFLTPDTPEDGFICRRIRVPNSVEFLALVTGALLSLQEPFNWEEFGSLTPDQTVAYFESMIDDFSLPGDRTCRVVGEIIAYAGTISPDPDWLLCEGQSVLRSDYPDLFTVIGTTYGSVDGTHFNLPDLQGRSIIGQGSGSGLTPRSVGDFGGEETHVLALSEIASHTHTDTGHTHTTGNSIILGTSAPPPLDALGPNPIPANTGSGSANLTSEGGDGAHENMHPFLALVYLIVAK